MRWPWTRKEPEKRQSQQPYSDAIINAITQQANGTISGDVLATAAVEMCAGSYARAFAVANIKSDNPLVKRVLTPTVMSSIARSCIRDGESLWTIAVKAGALRLVPVGSWDVTGDPDPESWFYRCDTFGPAGSHTEYLPAASVIHAMYSYQDAVPHIGLSPLQWASATGRLGAHLEQKLGDEISGPVGHVIPIPANPTASDIDKDTTTPGPLAMLRKDIATASGKTFLMETTAAGWVGDRQSAPTTDWISRRFGSNPPATLQVLRSDVGEAIIAACGLSVALFDDSDGTSKRESLRQATLSAYAALGKLVAQELSNKLGSEVRLSFRALWGHDQIGRSQSYKNLIASNMDADKAARLSGLEDD